jgi:hypothetical protein
MARVTAPTVRQAQAATDVVGFNLENSTASAIPARFITFQQTFQPAKVMHSANLVVSQDLGQSIPVQMDVKTTWGDGSVRSALLTLQHPSIPANSALKFMLSTTGTLPASAPLSLANLAYDLKVSYGSTVYDAATLLRTRPISYWQNGPLAVQGRVDQPVTGSLHLTIDITIYADGSVSADVQFNNDYAMQPAGGTVAYTASISEKGAVVLPPTSLTHHQYQTWHKVLGASPANVVQDIAYLIQAGAIPCLDLAAGVDSALLAGQHISGNQILGPGNITQNMPTTGGRADIGPMSAWNAIWLMTQSAAAAQYALVQADAAGSVPWHYFDPKKGAYLSLDDYPTLWTDPRGNPTLTQQTRATSWTLDTAHQPDLSYVPYLLTGRRYYLDQLNAQAMFGEFTTWNTPRRNGTGLVANGSDQVRAQAWCLRGLIEAAWMNPAGSADQARFQKIADNNFAWLVAQIPAWTTQQGAPYGWLPGDYRDGMAPWQQDYFASTMVAAVKMGFANALTFVNWQMNFLVGRFLNGANGFAPQAGCAYSLPIATTWEALGTGAASTFTDGDYAELAAETLAGIIAVTGSADAQKAYTWLMNSGAPQIKPYFVDPQLDIVP